MEIKRTHIIIGVAFAIPLLTISVLGFSGALKQKSGSEKYAEWMKGVNDETSLRDINMPGSHDSVSLRSIADVAGQCQSLGLEDQLNLGVRFLDIRLKEVKDKLIGVHGFVDQKIKFESIIDTVESFLNKHPSEGIIMSIKEETSSSKSTISFEESLKGYLDNELYLTDKTLPSKMKDIRGKVVLLSRYANSTIGIPAYEGWSDSASFTLPNDIYVQDIYKIKSKEEKQNEIIKCFNESGHALKINFLSAYRTNGFPPSYAPTAALDINPWIDENITNYSDRGIVLYDFVTEKNMDNFFKGVL